MTDTARTDRMNMRGIGIVDVDEETFYEFQLYYDGALDEFKAKLEETPENVQLAIRKMV